MGYPLIIHPLLSDNAVLDTRATVATSMPLSNLQTMQPTDRTRFVDPSETISFTVDLTAASVVTGITNWDFVGLFYANASEDATWRIKAANSEAGLTSPTYDSRVAGVDLNFWCSPGLKPYWDRVHGYHFIAAGARSELWLEIQIDDAANPDTFQEFGRLYIGKAYQPELPRQYGEAADDFEVEKSISAEGGPEYPRSDGPATLFPLVLQANGTDAKDEFMGNVRRLKRLRGTSRDIFVIDDPDEADWAMEHCCYGRMTNASSIRIPGHEQYECTLTVKELR